MECKECGKELDIIDPKTKAYIAIYQVRMGHLSHHEYPVGQLYEEFEPDEDVGYYCSDCLSKGV